MRSATYGYVLSGHSRHIGRVGALAVALGVGMAIATNPGTAWADSDADGSTNVTNTTSTTSTTDTHVSTTTSTHEQTQDTSNGPAATATTGVTPTEGSTPTTQSPTETTRTSTVAPEVIVRSSGGALTSGQYVDDPTRATPAPPAEDPPLVGSTTVDVDVDQAAPSRSAAKTPDVVVAQHSSPAVSTSSPALPTRSTPPSPEGKATPTPAPDVNQLVPQPAAMRMTTFAALTPAPAPVAVDPIAAFIAIPVGIITSVVNTLLSPFLAPAGPSSAQPPTIWALLAWVRREIQTTFFNRRPVLTAATDVEQVDRVITGTVIGTDPDGNKLTYSVPSPTTGGGTVAIDDHGNFTYVAPSSWTGATPLSDSFTVTVSDASDGFHIHGLAGLFFGSGHTASRLVSVTLAPSVPVDSIISSVTVPNGNLRYTSGVDGTIASSAQTGSGTFADPFRITTTVVRPGQPPVTSTALGSYVGGPVVTDRGTVAYTAVDRTGSGITTLTVMHPGQAATATSVAGQPYGGATYGLDGTVVQTVVTGFDASDPATTTVVMVARPGQPTTTVTSPGLSAGVFYPSADGTVAVLSNSSVGGIDTSAITVLRPGQNPEQYNVSGNVASLSSGADGTVGYSTTSGAGTTADPYSTTVTVLRSGQGPTSATVTGSASSVAVGDKGTVALTTITGSAQATDPADALTTTVTVLRPGKPVSTSTAIGQPYTTSVAADGSVVYMTTIPPTGPGDVMTTVTVLRDGENAVAIDNVISPNYLSPPVIGADGTVVSQTVPTGLNLVQVTVFRPGRPPVTSTASGSIATIPQVGSDGTVVFAANTGSGTTITVLRAGQAAQSVTVLGDPRNGNIGDDGTVAFTTRASSSLAYVTVFRNGQQPVTATTAGLISNPAVVGPDGTAYLFASTTGGTVSIVTVVPISGSPVTLTIPGRSFGVTVNPTGSGATLLTYTDDAVNGTRTYTVHAITVPGASTL